MCGILSNLCQLHRYKAAIRGVGITQNVVLPEERKHVDVPSLLIVSTKDYATRADMQKGSTAKWIRNLSIEELDCGHWVQLESPEKLNQLLEDFANKAE